MSSNWSIPYATDPVKKKAQAAQALSDLALNKANHPVIRRAQAVTPLIALLKGTDEQRNHAVVALDNLETEHQEYLDEIVDAGALPLIKMLKTGDDRLIDVAVLALTELMSNEDSHDVVVLHNGIKLLVQLLVDGVRDQRRYAALALNNLAASYRYQISQVGAVRLLCKLVSNGTSNEKLEAASALGTLAREYPVNCAVIADHGGMAALVALSNSKDKQQAAAATHTLGVIGPVSTWWDCIISRQAKHVEEGKEKRDTWREFGVAGYDLVC